ncbi:dual specificity protein kinase yak1, partial [Haplosporangium bisporale]
CHHHTCFKFEIEKTSHEFFEVGHSFGSSAPKKLRLKSMETYSKEHGVIEQPSKRHYQETTLPDIVNSYAFSKKGMSQKEIEK